MAKCRIEGIDDLVDSLNDVLDNIDEIVDEALFKGGNELRDNVRAKVKNAANRGYATGGLESSIIPTKPIKNDRGRFVAVRPVGQNSQGVRYGEIWGYLEHGVPDKQEAHPFIEDAVNASEERCAEIAQEVFNKHINL